MNEQGLVRCTSIYSFDETITRLTQAIKERGITLLAQIPHGVAARNVGLELRDTTVLIFGNPRGGTPLMAANQEAGLDLPLRILVWVDAQGSTQLTYNAPTWIAQRHGLGAALDAAVTQLGKALEDIVQRVAG
ncbi:DUF302 domain-containing protein [Oryzisolibacter sp. LB2S]|uniref:DUF302 domain-containing protein n=1 Tax=Alicycliphilus soli TaxID=3228789 RepID=UPI00345AAC98